MSRRNAPENFISAVRGCPRLCARTNPWFRGQTLLVLGHGGGGGGIAASCPGVHSPASAGRPDIQAFVRREVWSCMWCGVYYNPALCAARLETSLTRAREPSLLPCSLRGTRGLLHTHGYSDGGFHLVIKIRVLGVLHVVQVTPLTQTPPPPGAVHMEECLGLSPGQQRRPPAGRAIHPHPLQTLPGSSSVSVGGARPTQPIRGALAGLGTTKSKVYAS